MRRFLLHVLPSGLKRIRHYGLLAPSKGQALAQARAQMQMQMPQSNAVALESAQDVMRRVANVDLHQCPRCQMGRLQWVETCKGLKTLQAPGFTSEIMPRSTGPP